MNYYEERELITRTMRLYERREPWYMNHLPKLEAIAWALAVAAMCFAGAGQW